MKESFGRKVSLSDFVVNFTSFSRNPVDLHLWQLVVDSLNPFFYQTQLKTKHLSFKHNQPSKTNLLSIELLKWHTSWFTQNQTNFMMSLILWIMVGGVKKQNQSLPLDFICYHLYESSNDLAIYWHFQSIMSKEKKYFVAILKSFDTLWNQPLPLNFICGIYMLTWPCNLLRF